MYIATLKNGDILTEIHNEEEKLKSGSVVQGINTIDSFSFTLLPSNIGFNLIRDFQTLVNVFNTNTGKYEFHGRVLYSRVAMETNGLITKEVTCESFFGYLCDSVQEWVQEQNWTVDGLLRQLINCHNSQVEEHKRFKIGEVDSSLDDNDNTFVGIQREKTWDAIRTKLLDRLGGEIRFRVEEDGLYIDYMKEFGETVETEIALSKNMKAIAREHDPSTYVTRLYPYGCKLKNAEGNETEQRLDISSVNGGKKYIDDEEGIEAYGVHAGFVEFDDVTTANILLTKGRNWLAENNLLQVKYSITALDLSLLGLDINSFEIYNRHPIKNHLISVEDTARIIKKTLNICEEVQSTIEVGDNFKTLTDIQNEQAGQIKEAINIINNLQSTTNVKVENAEQAANDAEKVATNYLDFAGKHGEGLVIGALTEETLGRNIQLSGDSILFRDGQTVLADYSATQILLGRTTSNNMLINTSGVDIRNGTTTLARYGTNKILLGMNSRATEIDLCGGLAQLSNYSTDSWNRLTIKSKDGIYQETGGEFKQIAECTPDNGATKYSVKLQGTADSPWDYGVMSPRISLVAETDTAQDVYAVGVDGIANKLGSSLEIYASGKEYAGISLYGDYGFVTVNGQLTLSENIRYVLDSRVDTPFYVWDGDANGMGIRIGAGGAVVVGAGESATNLINALDVAGHNEELYLSSDNSINFYTNCQDIGSRKNILSLSAGGVANVNGSLTVNGTAVSTSGHTHSDYATSDRVTSSGYTDGWYWEKWASGKAVCWKQMNITITGWSAWGNLFEATPGFGENNYPSGLFKYTPNCTCLAQCDGLGFSGVETYQAGSSTKCPKFFMLRPNNPNTTGVVAMILVKAIGRWQ